MDINDILSSLGLDLSDPETKRGALEAIDAILQSRQPEMSIGDLGSLPGGEMDIELDPDLLQPSQKHQSQPSSDDVEIEDEENLLDQIKHNESEDDFDNDIDSSENSSSNSSNDTAEDPDSMNTESDINAQPEEESEEAATPDSTDSEKDVNAEQQNDEEVDNDVDNANKDSSDVGIDEPDGDSHNDEERSDEPESDEKLDNIEAENELDSDETEADEYDEDDFLDDDLKDTYDDKEVTSKHDARKIKRERTLAAAKKALADAQNKKVAPALIRELEQAIAALEELTEAVTKSLKDISDEEFNLLVNRVFDAIEAVGDSSLTFTSEEERELKAQEIKNDLASNQTQTELSAEDVAKIRAETQAIKAREKETAKYQQRSRRSFKGFQDFLNSLYRAIALQVSNEESNDDSWSAINRRYGGTGVLQPGKRLNELPNKKIPIIDFYFDQSGSWTERDIEVGKKAVSKLADMEADGQIKVNVYYFANNVYTDAESARNEGGTWAWNEIVKNIIATRATNVVIMTDEDMEDRWGSWSSSEKALTYTVPGYVWYLWRNGENAPRLPRDLKGRGGVQQFSFSSSDL